MFILLKIPTFRQPKIAGDHKRNLEQHKYHIDNEKDMSRDDGIVSREGLTIKRSDGKPMDIIAF